LAACVVLTAAAVAVLLPAGSGAALPPGPAAAAPDLLALFLSGLKVGLLTFGGAYAAIPFLRDDAVGRGWLSEAQFLDGMAIAGALPAPLIIFSTFVGWAAGGAPGALLMTGGVFLPAFAFSLLLFERIEALAEARRLRLFLGGVTAAVVGLIAAATFDLGEALLARTPSLPVGALIFALALLALYGWRSRASVPLTVLGGGGAGALLFG
jgi:chromate transporter